MEHLALEVFDLDGTGSQFATLPSNTTIHIRSTSQIFGSGAVFSQEFTLNIPANAHLFGTAGDIHGSRLHEQMNKRKARIWAEGLPLYLGYLRLADEVDVDEDGNVGVTFESGQKTFEEMIEGTKAREVSVGDVVIGVALNRKRVSTLRGGTVEFHLDGLKGYAAKDSRLEGVQGCRFSYMFTTAQTTPYVQRWPKLVKSYGEVLDSTGAALSPMPDYTNIQSPYDDAHPFCNINICYPLKVNKEGEEIATRGYTIRLAHSSKPTTDGGDNQTRYNNSPNFYLLHFIDRLFKDLKIHISENQAMDVEDLRRVFMLNYGCHYEEIENSDYESPNHTTPEGKRERYGQYYLPLIDADGEQRLVKSWKDAGKSIIRDDVPGKVLLRNVVIEKDGYAGELLSIGSVEGTVFGDGWNVPGVPETDPVWDFHLEKNSIEESNGAYSAYLAYATGDNYPNVDINEIIEAMKSMFGVRFLFSDDYKQVRIILLRNIFRSTEVQNIQCDIIKEPTKTENSIRGFRMTYGKGTQDTNYYYKGFNDLFNRVAKTWKDTTDTHDYSQWEPNAEYGEVKQRVSAMDKTCYITPANGNAYLSKVDEEEDVLYPTLVEVAGFIDAEDGDCSRMEDEGKTIEEVTISASPVIMNEIGDTYASLFTGELKAPSPENFEYATKIATFGRISPNPILNFRQRSHYNDDPNYFTVSGKLDVYISEGFQIRMEDNYAISNGGTPFDEADPGLQFGIMRSSGADAHILYDKDEIENEEPLNDYWDVVPGDGAIDHPDTCDNYGNEWDYNGTQRVTTSQDAAAKLQELFPDSNAPFYKQGAGHISDASIVGFRDDQNAVRTLLIAIAYFGSYIDFGPNYIPSWNGHSAEEVKAMDAAGYNIIVEIDSSFERKDTLLDLCRFAYASYGKISEMIIDNGVGSRYGRFSLKLRAEKLNPYFDPKQAESSSNRRYLEITNDNLKGRGLCDQFYKEYSYFVRNARITNIPVRMELAQLLAIDDTVRATVGDMTGFINEMEYDISMETGLGNVTMQMMYI